MSEHEKVVRDTLTRLYQRIDGPTAVDAAAYRIALTAVGELVKGDKAAARRLKPTPDADPKPQVGEEYYETLSAKAVVEAVDDGLITAAEALELENAGKQRVKLTAWLKEQVEGGNADG